MKALKAKADDKSIEEKDDEERPRARTRQSSREDLPDHPPSPPGPVATTRPVLRSALSQVPVERVLALSIGLLQGLLGSIILYTAYNRLLTSATHDQLDRWRVPMPQDPE